MPDNEYVQLRDGYVYLRLPKGQPVSVVLNAIKAAVTLCVEQQCFKLLENVKDFAEDPRTTMQMFTLVSDVGAIWDRRIRMAVVDPDGWLKADNFPETVARNRGIPFTIFTNDDEAIKWLLT